MYGAFTISSSCLRLVALAIGAVMLGFAISQASAICAGGRCGARPRVERLEDTQAAGVEIALEALAAPGMFGAFLRRAVFAGEEAGRERVVVDDAELFLPADRLEFGLESLRS